MKTLYPLKKIEIRRSEVLGQISEEIPGPEPTALSEPSTPPLEEASASVADAGEGPAA